ncbi:oligoendopeptidase F [Brachyspira hyodysenteriae]|uniref:Oligopeptidase F n=1 Tax=Brachyspira hyodysenteriae (strain ATCC 49526 / WA1) TaxID=565034 RepID=A0A3B6VE65_BRAHW|nr:oligoendopeptidase F [Brachyspira hyodysenteriae]ACN83104.1 peptidase [Brachyspira hyodysenteriae WA1]KLI32906.1 oligoendopeptidase F [Brachyspira hyodysenteriae]KLI42237.1 oligoendopeptidase F [Brachyspira hyodysenteriae]KLI44252.1 oligoendopeptidase F [Brachyspira hyodysenteriae]KLI48271.1 oligoendopeptidase F [Brachyspira hyodysenteriae]
MSNENKSNTLIERKDVKIEDTWDLTLLYKNDEEFEKDFKAMEDFSKESAKFKGNLSKSASELKNILDSIMNASIILDKLGSYAFLKQTEDLTNNDSNIKIARFSKLASEFSANLSYFDPELMSIDDEKMNSFLKDEVLKDYLIYLRNILKYKPHTLSEKEERILALQGELASTASNVFDTLNDADLNFGELEHNGEKTTLTHATFSSFQESQDRELRKNSYNQFYKEYDKHKNTFAELYASQIKQDIFDARIRNYNSVREMELFGDDIPVSVYDSLIESVHNALPALHSYYEYCANKLGITDFRQYDKYAPVVKDVKIHHTFDEAITVLSKALSPLGEEYVSTLTNGLNSRWVDKYENKGKTSGAFSAGCYTSEPYILMNFRDESIESVFTLAHEAGHSMHSYYSRKNNPFQHHDYSIFEAEVASTFNEKLLFNYFMQNESKKEVKAFLLNKDINGFVATVFRQTMFAEFEHIIHKEAEEGNPTTLELIRTVYKDLLKKYFGDKAVLEETSDLEALRIPHFYRSFYVYKYATGMSAAVALSNGVLEGNAKGDYTNRDNYLKFLKSGGSRTPIENLKVAGVDMTKPEVVESALKLFAKEVEELKSLN